MLANRLMHTTVALFVAAVGVGVALGADQNDDLAHLYAHIALLGWVALGMIGLIYAVHPNLQHGKLTELHYWLHTVGLAAFIAGYAWSRTSGQLEVLPVAFGAMLVSLGMLLFALHAFRRSSRTD